jgi:hypothetical protein
METLWQKPGKQPTETNKRRNHLDRKTAG